MHSMQGTSGCVEGLFGTEIARVDADDPANVAGGISAIAVPISVKRPFDQQVNDQSVKTIVSSPTISPIGMSFSLRDYSTPELEALLDQVRTAIREAEKAERQKAKRQARLAANPPETTDRAPPGPAAEAESDAGAVHAFSAESQGNARPKTLGVPDSAATKPRAGRRASAGADGQTPAPGADLAGGAGESAQPLQSNNAQAPEVLPPSGQTGESPCLPPIKYMHPSNRKMTWSGEGEQPEWMKIYLALGGTWTALENTAQRFTSGGKR